MNLFHPWLKRPKKHQIEKGTWEAMCVFWFSSLCTWSSLSPQTQGPGMQEQIPTSALIISAAIILPKLYHLTWYYLIKRVGWIELNSKTLLRTILLSVFWAQVLKCKFTTKGFLCIPCLQFARFQEGEVKKIKNTKQLVLFVTESFSCIKQSSVKDGKEWITVV